MPDPQPIRILVLAAPGAPGAAALLSRARAEHVAAGRPLELLLSGPGLAWAGDTSLSRLAALPGVSVGLCSRSARDRGVVPDSLPPWIRWTSLVAFLTALGPDAELWGILP